MNVEDCTAFDMALRAMRAMGLTTSNGPRSRQFAQRLADAMSNGEMAYAYRILTSGYHNRGLYGV